MFWTSPPAAVECRPASHRCATCVSQHWSKPRCQDTAKPPSAQRPPSRQPPRREEEVVSPVLSLPCILPYFSPLICRAKCGSTLSRFVRLRFSLQPLHNTRQFGAQPRGLNCVIVRNGIRQKAFKFLDVAVKAGYNLSVQNRQNLS